MSSGLYFVRSTSPTDGDSLNGVWLAVADPEPSYPVQNEVDHQYRRRIVSGQTVLGEFGTLAPPVGDFTDHNGYYFLGTAGSRITVSLERVDTTKTWEHPDSIDPDLRIVAPDGMIYGNLYKYDNREGVDLNATITNAALPQTGIYRIVAGTSHGSGAYRLQFNVDSVAPVNVGERIIPMGGMGATLPVGQPYDVFAAVLDSRGHPVSSANVNWTAMAGAPVFLNGTSSATSFDGVAGISLRLDTPGIVRVKADATDPLLNLGAMQGEEFLKQALPRFDAVGSGPRFEGMGKNGEPRFSNAPVKTLPAELFERSRELSTPSSTKTPAAKPGTAKGKAPAPAKPASEAVVEKGAGVKISRASFPLPATAMLQNNCSNSAGTIDLGAVAGTPDGPYTFTLTDVTGGGSKVINGAAGFEDLYIGKTRTLRLDIKDATGATPNYPIVVRVGTSGTRAGTVALDANAPGCNSMFFLWHESPLLPNDLITYTLGTRAFPAEFVNNPAQPGTVKPVWATTELLDVAVYVPAETILERRTAVLYPVKPMAGEPHHLVHYDYRDMSVLPDVIKKFTGYSLTPLSGDLYGNVISSRITIANTYFLEDALGNTCAGYWNTSADDVTPSNSNIEVEFLPQNDGVYSGSQYTNTIRWSGNATLPSGNYTTQLKVTYPASAEGGWGGGQVTKNLTYELSSTARKVLLSRGAFGYDKIQADGTLGVEDAPFPISVSAGAETAGLPKTQIGDTPRLALLLTEGSRYAADDPSEPTPAGGVLWSGGPSAWTQNGTFPDPRLQVGSTAPFTLRLIDKDGVVVPEASFTVHLNARYEHLAGPCTAPSVVSTGGAISGVVAPCGYLGIELTKAPIAPGEYYIDVRSENGEYDVRHAARLSTDPTPAGAVQGAFALCAVEDGEFLDANFSRVQPIPVDEPVVAYVRVGLAAPTQASYAVTLYSFSNEGTPLAEDVPLILNRVGKTKLFLGMLTFVPEGYPHLVSGTTLSVALGEGSAEARSADAPAASAPVGRRNSLVAGRVLARTLPAFRPTLQLRFLKRPQSIGSVPTEPTESATGDPEDSGKIQQTLIASGTGNYDRARGAYSETVWIEVRAVNRFRTSQTLPVRGGRIGLIEDPNPGYSPDTDRFYDEANSLLTGTWLESSGEVIQALPTASVGYPELVAGVARIPLRSVAYKRYARLPNSATRGLPVAPPYSGLGGSALRAVPAPGHEHRLRPSEESRVLRVGHWVDERTGGPHVPGVEAWTGPADPAQPCADWLEAMAWDYLASIPSSADPEKRAARDSVQFIRQRLDLPPGLAAAVIADPAIPSSKHTINFNPLADILRSALESEFDVPYKGIRRTRPRDVFSALMSHESRHCWQSSLFETTCSDADKDELIDNPSCVGVSAHWLADSLNWSVGGLQPDGHFRGSTFHDFKNYTGGGPQYFGQKDSLTAAAFERDSIRFEADHEGTVLECGYDSLELVSGDGQSASANSDLPEPLVVRAMWKKASGAAKEKLIGVSVRFEVEDPVLDPPQPASGTKGRPEADGASSAFSAGPVIVFVNDSGEARLSVKAGTRSTIVRASVIPSSKPPCNVLAMPPVSFSIAVTN